MACAGDDKKIYIYLKHIFTLNVVRHNLKHTIPSKTTVDGLTCLEMNESGCSLWSQICYRKTKWLGEGQEEG